MPEMTPEQLFEEFLRFKKARESSAYQSMPVFEADPATQAREIAFNKWQDLQHASAHAALLSGAAKADALEGWHRQMIQFGILFDKCKPFDPFKKETASLPGTGETK